MLRTLSSLPDADTHLEDDRAIFGRVDGEGDLFSVLQPDGPARLERPVQHQVLQVVTQDERQLPGRHQVAIVGHGRTLPHAQMPFTMKSRIDWVTFLSSSVYV